MFRLKNSRPRGQYKCFSQNTILPSLKCPTYSFCDFRGNETDIKKNGKKYEVIVVNMSVITHVV